MQRPRILPFETEPRISAVIALIKALRIKINKYTVVDTLKSHPDWPSLLAISDALKKWSIPNAAAKMTIDEIDQIPTPFLAKVHDPNQPLYLVTDVNDEHISILDKNFKHNISIAKEDFAKKWSGIFIMTEPNDNAGEENYKPHRNQAWIQSLLPTLLILLAIGLSFSTIFKNNAEHNIFIIFEYFILVAGIMVSTLLLWYELDKNNPLLQKVCAGISKGNCNAILTSQQAKLFSWLSWSEVGFIYFAGGLLTLLFLKPIAIAISILALFHIIAFPYTLFSIYYQWRIARQWCLLCLAVQALLIVGFILGLSMDITYDNFVSSRIIFYTLLMYAIPALLWFAFKPAILRLQKSEDTEHEYSRFKFNEEIFDTLLKKNPITVIPSQDLGIDLGNPEAAHTLIKVCNPYCGPCARAHPKIEKLLHQVDNLKVKIIFTSKNDDKDPGKAPVSHLLAISAKKNNVLKEKAIDDWYLAEKKDYPAFAARYPMNGELELQGAKLEAMSKWCEEVLIEHTPTFFINGYRLPAVYDIEDLKYFLQE